MKVTTSLITITGFILSLLGRAEKATAFHVTPPTSNNDWKQIAALVVKTFDAPSMENMKDTNNAFNAKLWWDLVDEKITQRFTYNTFVRNARKLNGKKYAIFVAKNGDDVIGMVELGMALMDKSITEAGNVRKPYATIGVLCVQDEFKKYGVGSALVKKCEHVVNTMWDENEVYVQVEPHNSVAMKFFEEKCEYCNTNMLKNVTVARRRTFEERPHLILKKYFNTTLA